MPGTTAAAQHQGGTTLFVLRHLLACALLAAALPVVAQGFPSCRSMRMVIAYPAGGPTDLQGRILAQKLSERWGQQLVVENRGGGGTVIATTVVAKANADGCTLLLTALPFAINPFIIPKLPYEAKDLAPVTQTTRFPQVLVVHPDLPVKTVKELLGYAAANPGKVSYASSGNLGTGHLAGELLSTVSGVNLLHIQYKGSAPAHPDVMSGRVPVMFDSVGGINKYIVSGQVRPIAVTTAARSPELPNVPTVAESGFPGFEVSAWQGIVTTGGTRKDIVAKLSSDIASVLASPDMRERLARLSAEPVGSTPAEFEAFIRAEAARWGKIIRERKIRTE
jgi:tripartite-type tricarboxylate transporter receptor subunit TctC